MTRSIVWLKRCLRVHDHAPLREAARRGPTLALYVYEPDVLNAVEHDPSHLVFINQCLLEVRDQLRASGSDLLIRHGTMPETLEKLHGQLRFDALWSHEETGLAATFERDKRVRRWSDHTGVRWTELPQHGVVRPLKSRDGWADRWRARMQEIPLEAPTRIEPYPDDVVSSVHRGEILKPTELGLPESEKTGAQVGGESCAAALLDSFLHVRGENYQKDMSTPVEGWDSCSRLSAHFAYGSISIRTAHHAALTRATELKGDPTAKSWRASIASFQKRLRWHCHFMQKLEDEPEIEFRNFSRAFDGLREEDLSRWTEEDHAQFIAWQNGLTGYPLVDACMRCLKRTGWINFRMRSMLVSFAAYHLWLHWRPVAEHLAQQFLDFEPGIHYSQCQMQSGMTGINAVRIYSPSKQVIDQDPTGLFIRRWVPELRDVPDEHLPNPELMPALTQRMANCGIGADYPAPIVDHAIAYREARAKIHEARSKPEAREEAARVYEKHGSRRRPSRSRSKR